MALRKRCEAHRYQAVNLKNWRKFLAGMYGGNGRVYVAVVKRIRSRRRDPLFGSPHALARLGPQSA